MLVEPDPQVLRLTVDLVSSDPWEGAPAVFARSIMSMALRGFVTNSTPSPIPAVAHRTASSVHDFGR